MFRVLPRHCRTGRCPHGAASALAVLLFALVLATNTFAYPSGVDNSGSGSLPPASGASAPVDTDIPVLVYHRFGPTAIDSMTVSFATFESQLHYISDHGYHVVPLQSVFEYLNGKAVPLPPNPIAITADDGHISIYNYMAPLMKRLRIPVTLFIYPSAISNADYAMTWEQLAELKGTGLFTIQSHTYWHPNFKIEKRRLSAAEYDRFAQTQMVKARQILEKKLDARVDMLAWPFGIYDDELIDKARASGYVAAFTIERRNATRRDNVMAIPRYLIADTDKGKTFSLLLAGKAASPRPRSR